MQGLGIESGVDLAKLVAVGHWISSAIHRPNGARSGLALHAGATPANPAATA
jgi:hydroxymethylglutaryl-CoA lyase